MDLIKEFSKNINLYEVKAQIRKAQNVALNLSEMETKVREATNNEPWGAKTTLMEQIAAGTYNYREREEILSFIFRRFTEKAANEWRQIYKSLQLVEYLVKHGLERIIDDIRANLSLIQMLKSFHYIDSKGRDQGINVRNRSKNLIALLNDDALIRLERKKARSTAKKFGGVSSAAYGGASSVAVGDGFGGDDDFTNRVYGDGGVFGARYDDPASAYNNGATGDNNFEEYDVEATTTGARALKPTTGSSKINAGAEQSNTRAPALPVKNKPQPQAPAQDLLGDLLGDLSSAPPAASTSQNAGAAAEEDDDDDFDDFQSAPSLSANVGASAGAGLSNNFANLYVSQPNAAPLYGQQQQSQPNYNFNTGASGSGSGSGSAGPAKASNDAFSSLFSSAKTKTTSAPKAKQAAPVAHAAPAAQNNDFLFDDFSAPSNGNSHTASNTSKPQQNSSSNNGEIDLLSF